MEPLRFVVIGLGGYALVHLDAIRWLAQLGLARLTGVVALAEDRKKNSAQATALQEESVRLFDSVDDFFARGLELADVLAIPIGIHQHVPVSCAAMQAGLHVYCEKPLAATVQEVDQVIQARNASGRKIAVGFQHIYSNSIQQLKARICAGRLGRVQYISLLCGWPRSLQYFARNEWAGKMRLGNEWVLDSPANNAHAHYLLNMLYLASTQEKTADIPIELRAELYRANPIESCDTVQMKFTTREGVNCHALLTHANAHPLGPHMRIVGEKGIVTWETDNGKTVIEYAGGTAERFDNEAHAQWRYEGFKDLVHAIHDDTTPLCTPEIARSQTLAINAMHESCHEIVTVPEKFIDHVEDWEMFPPETKGSFNRIRDFDQSLQDAFDRGVFLSELGLPWAKSKTVETFAIRDYGHFPSYVFP
ncbi:MAG: Gfo/Idh/MocA family protein [bacterium]